MSGLASIHRGTWGFCALGLLTLLAAGACGGPSRRPPPADGRAEHVVLVLVDTLRADHLSAYGYHRPTSPTIDRFARQGYFFADARAQASCTFPSVNSIFTSRWPIEFYGQEEQAMGIPGGITTVAQILSNRGYQTIALSASPIVRRLPSKHNPGGGFDAGFDVFDDRCMWRRADCLHRGLGEQLAAIDAERPVFLYLHYMEPHGRYDAPQRRFAGAYAGANPFIAAGDPNPIADMIYSQGPEVEVTEADRRHLLDLYDDEIASFDASFGALLETLERRLEGPVAVVLLSDHGESFLEHGEIKHCRSLYDTEVKTPLVARLPGLAPATAVIARPVQNLDVVPTLLDYLGIDPAPYDFAGHSLLPALRGEPLPERPVFSLQGRYRSVVAEGHKLIYTIRPRSFQLFDLAADPAELEERSSQRPELRRRLQKSLARQLIDTEGSTDSERSRLALDQAEKLLRSLGYLQ